MIATISPNQINTEHTLNTLRYAYRVKEIRREEERELAAAGPRRAVSLDGILLEAARRHNSIPIQQPRK